MNKEQKKNACDWLENLEGDAWADACEEIAGAVKRQAEGAQGDLDEYAEFESWLEREKTAGCVGDMERGWMARAALAQPSPKCPVCKDSGIMGHSDLCVACDTNAQSSPKCATCDDNGRIGGPSFYAPDEGGEPCPDCAQPSPAPELDDQAFDRNAERLTLQALGPGAGINPEATSIDDIFIDEAPTPGLDFSKPLETEKGEPVKWICADVIEYKSARVCVAKDTGLVYSSPYIGLKIRNVVPAPAPDLEQPEVDMPQAVIDSLKDAYHERISLSEAAAVICAAHERIVGALRAQYCANQHRTEWQNIALQAEQQRDAAKARVAKLEKQEPFYYFADCDDPDYSRLYNTEGDALSQISDHGGDVVKLYVNPVAQAGQVPEELAAKINECLTLAFEEITLYVSPEKCRDPRSRARRAAVLATEIRSALSSAPQPAKGE